MSEGPFLTEWMDLEPYPGPLQEDPSEFWREIIVSLGGRHSNAVKTSIRQMQNAFSQVSEEVMKGNQILVSLSDELNKSADEMGRRIDDRRIFNHGPRPGSGYDLYGKKKY